MKPGPVSQPIKERLLKNSDRSGECWLWLKSCNYKGYGQIGWKGKTYKTHRVSFEVFVGPIPAGLQIDHLCRIRHCIRPSHLEPVTCKENIRRGIRSKLDG